MKNEIITTDALPSIIQTDIEKKQLTKISTISKSIKRSLKIDSNKFLRTLNQLPIISHALKYEKGFKAIIPEQFKEGLKNGTLKIMQGKDGSAISTIVDANGKIVHQLRLEEFTKLVNPAELSQAMNQICMQMQLDEIQKNLSEFRIEVNSKLNEVLRNFHENRQISFDSLKLSFERYQKGEDITKSQLLSKIDDAKASLCKDIQSQIDSLKSYISKPITEELNSEIQTKIGYVLEDIDGLRNTFLIDCYLNKDDVEKVYELTNSYTNNFLNTLSIENLKLLNEFSDFGTLNLDFNIWEKDIIPQMNNISIEYSKSKYFLSGDTSK